MCVIELRYATLQTADNTGHNEKVNLTFRVPCIVKYSYNKSQQDALFFQIYFGKELCMFRTGPLSIIRSLNTVHTAISICRASYFDCLLARSGWNILTSLTDSHHN
jgi:hypothetical protein